MFRIALPYVAGIMTLHVASNLLQHSIATHIIHARVTLVYISINSAML